ncbi:MAG: radical SAM protein [Coriobacteriia bacterium]|nr:radical SAM protein [Coriobacteriia bacterium]
MSVRPPHVDPTEMYVLPLADRWLVFAPATWSVAVVNHTALGELAQCCEPGHVAPSLESLELWQTLTIAPAQASRYRPQDVGKLVIMPTRACNISCVHCDFGCPDASLTVLDPQLAYPLIDRVLAHTVRDRESVMRVHFFGGEPLVARRSVEAIVAYTRRACAKAHVTPWFELTTNGVCSPEAVKFLGDEIDSVVVSLDGDEALHNGLRRHRDGRGTYAEVAETIRQLSRYPCELCLRMCVTDHSVEALPRLAERFCTEFDISVLAFETLAETPGSAEAGLYAPDPYAFALNFMQAESIGAEHGVRVVHGPSELEGPRSTSCPLGTGSLMLWPDGAITGCYLEPERWRSRGLELSFGNVDEAGVVHVDERQIAKIDKKLERKPRCERCFCRYTCAGGCRVEQTPPRCSRFYDERCRAIRLITASRLLLGIDATEEAAALLVNEMAAAGLASNADDRLHSWAKVV